MEQLVKADRGIKPGVLPILIDTDLVGIFPVQFGESFGNAELISLPDMPVDDSVDQGVKERHIKGLRCAGKKGQTCANDQELNATVRSEHVDIAGLLRGHVSGLEQKVGDEVQGEQVY